MLEPGGKVILESVLKAFVRGIDASALDHDHFSE